MNIKTPKGEGEFRWLFLGGCCGSLAYVVFFAWEGARDNRRRGTERALGRS